MLHLVVVIELKRDRINQQSRPKVFNQKNATRFLQTTVILSTSEYARASPSKNNAIRNLSF
jgi:hypothetical protein